ncbi:MAG: NTP transferase domain-containing protein [Candidatus Omnitrophota bacterium]|nr:NTP transferase domain-containing protein [Candidatus Omnitrophota bacterium]
MHNGLTAIILAAGKSTRMNSAKPKVLHELCGKPLISYVLDLCLSLKVHHIIVVTGWGKEKILDYIQTNYRGKNIDVVIQEKMLGTADAILSARPKIKKEDTDLLILYGDQPLFGLGAARKLVNEYFKKNAACVLFTADLENPRGYGRIIRGSKGEILGIREDKNLNRAQESIKEVNAGSCIFKKEKLFGVINRIKSGNKKHEYYLTDAVKLLRHEGENVFSVKSKNELEVLGVNSRFDLIQMERILRKRLIEKFIAQGVTVKSPETTFINHGAKIGRDTVINPFVYIDSNVKIGKNCTIGPFSHIRGESEIKDNVIVGSFGELNRTSVGSNSRIKHFSYLGDAEIGRNVNIGAGTVTANYDGKSKHKTCIKDGAFIGSDTVLVAPLIVGKHAITGAGCVVPKCKNVPDGAVVAGVPARPLRK